ncbi:cation channel sperm-associated auxiliary subunit delta isoform X2 [Talpa occidentalis]|uniref:cation channel sperm-associated auxiliary subunit delta isoform X2 n=1 Tax=Talpa occidentalis TaxID=50954 RepID=UPI00188E52E8|nr:cation channel sperm-associated auxiliary subunit delta isoform X2 [Talpa occidentalis]
MPGRPVRGHACVHTVRTGKVFHNTEQVEGDQLYFPSTTPRLFLHPCEKDIALYLGTEVFLTKDGFTSSILPFSIPTSMMVGKPEVTSAHFSTGTVVLVVNQKVYVYDYEGDRWHKSSGIDSPVSHVSGDNCCHKALTCLEMNDKVIAYLLGDQISHTNIYWSLSQGFSFQKIDYKMQAKGVGTLGGIFNFGSLSQIGMLSVDQGKARFSYSTHPLNRNFGVSFDYNETLDVLLAPGQRGIILLWSQKTLMISRNAGQLVSSVWVQERPNTLYSIFDTNITIHNVAANENEMAVLTQENNLYYGNLGILSNSLIKFSDQNIWSPQSTLMFTGVGSLEILTPLPDKHFAAFDFQKCPVNIQRVLMDPKFDIGVCEVEFLYGEFENELFTMDMNSELELTAIMIPRPGSYPIPLVVVSNPHSLGLDTFIYEDGYTYDGNIKYRLNISLRQQHHRGRSNPNFTSSIKRPTMSTITVDLANKELSCVDLKPVSAIISVGCDITKKIVVQNKVSACSKGILDPRTLQENYYYVIEKEAYDPNYEGHKADVDLVVSYRYERLGCPLLVYYHSLWKPVVELWRGESFQEIVEAEYVLLELNGLFTYKYSLTAHTAHCSSQPQNWSTIRKGSFKDDAFSWSRENYMSCHDPDNHDPLLWPNVQYQILGGPTDNRIAFNQRNGIYIFLLSIVDPHYTYCSLQTTFSVFVYGASPVRTISFEFWVTTIMLSLLLSVCLAYTIPRQINTKLGLRVRKTCMCLCKNIRKICRCLCCRKGR